VRPVITVAIPVLDAGPSFEAVLTAVTGQRVAAEIELLICDSGSRDGSPSVARAHGATVIAIDRRDFSHGATRNLLMERSHGDHVAFLTQDAEPADAAWLSRLRGAFDLASDVGLTFGPYRPRPDASPMVARELTEWFAAFAPDGRTRVARLDEAERGLPARALLGPRGFFTDANGCVSRAAWERVGFRAVAHSEDHALAHDMLRAGFAKVFVPDAAVVHSHRYSNWGWLQRSFDEARALHDLYGWRAPADPRTLALNVWGMVGADRRWARGNGAPAGPELLARATAYHVARTAGTALGGRADRLPPALSRRLSHEGRAR
jgi:GT2 family glycosyltransferase